jgi:hypothetical protein
MVAGYDRESLHDPESIATAENQIRERLADPKFVKDLSNRDLVDLLQTEFTHLKRRQIYELVLRQSKG